MKCKYEDSVPFRWFKVFLISCIPVRWFKQFLIFCVVSLFERIFFKSLVKLIFGNTVYVCQNWYWAPTNVLKRNFLGVCWAHGFKSCVIRFRRLARSFSEEKFAEKSRWVGAPHHCFLQQKVALFSLTGTFGTCFMLSVAERKDHCCSVDQFFLDFVCNGSVQGVCPLGDWVALHGIFAVCQLTDQRNASHNLWRNGSMTFRRGANFWLCSSCPWWTTYTLADPLQQVLKNDAVPAKNLGPEPCPKKAQNFQNWSLERVPKEKSKLLNLKQTALPQKQHKNAEIIAQNFSKKNQKHQN